MKQLMDQILEDGVISVEEVELVREAIFADGKVSKEEVEFLFKLKETSFENGGAEEAFIELFKEAVESYSLLDEETPGVISKEEGDFISSLITSDSVVDSFEREILNHLKEKATSIESEALNILINN